MSAVAWKGSPPSAQCQGKEKYETPELAHAVLRRRLKRQPGISKYRCPYCGMWHIGRKG